LKTIQQVSKCCAIFRFDSTEADHLSSFSWYVKLYLKAFAARLNIQTGV
jgi:hypothetical protein